MKLCAAGVVQTVVMARYMLDWCGDSHAAPRLTVLIHGRSVSLSAGLAGVTARASSLIGRGAGPATWARFGGGTRPRCVADRVAVDY